MTEPQEIVELVATLKAALLEYPSPHIQGAKLNEYIREVAPELNVRETVGIPVGPGALKKFVATYLLGALTHVGYNGGDVVYEITGHPIKTSYDAAPAAGADPNIWKTFVSPGSTQQVVLSAGRDSILRKGKSEIDPDESIVRKVSISEHDEIRDRFIESLGEEFANGSEGSSQAIRDYGEWLNLVRERGLSKPWGEYRRNALLKVFRARLEELDVSPSTITALAEQLKASQAATITQTPLSKSPVTQRVLSNNRRDASTSASSRSQSDHGRALAHSAIDAMSYDELRSIRLPLGVILDVIKDGLN